MHKDKQMMVRGAFPVPFLRLPKPPLTLTSGAIPRPRGVQPAFPCAAAAQEIPAWRRTPPQERIQYLFQYRSLLEEDAEEIARLTTQAC